MQTRLADFIRNTAEGAAAEAILRSCVHCGFCNATCPTYQLLADERDGPRGRIYLIKQVLEGESASSRTQLHLDRCLTCRACETTCPSGVEYARLLDIGRAVVEQQVRRPVLDRLQRALLRAVMPYPSRFGPLLRLARYWRRLLPVHLERKVPVPLPAGPWPIARHSRYMLIPDGCVQSVLAPNINAAAAKLLDRIDISLIRAPAGGCCGALSYHLGAHDESLNFMRRNIDAWWPHVAQGIEAIAMTASACAVMVKDYGTLLRHDVAYAAKAAHISALTKSIGEILAAAGTALVVDPGVNAIACHSPCTLQHGQQLPGLVEGLLSRLGFALTPVEDAHLCCGSAGTYSILQPALSERLLASKIRALEHGHPDVIVTDNIGCLVHLQSATAKPVRHWVDVLAEALGNAE